MAVLRLWRSAGEDVLRKMFDYLRDGRMLLPVTVIIVLSLAGCAVVPAWAPAAATEDTVKPTTRPVDLTPEGENPPVEQPTATPSAQPAEPPTPTSSVPPAAEPATATPPSPTDTPPAPQLSTDPAVLLLTNVARADLARRLKAAEGAVLVLSAEQTEMPVGSLGCTETDGPASQGIVMGTEIVLSAGGQEYIYRADNARLVPCFPANFPGGRAPIFVTGAGLPRTRDLPKRTVMPPDGPPETGQRQPAVKSALADLAGRLKIAETQIAVRGVEAVDWPDASLGCAQRGRMYAQVITPGYRILLEAGGKVYEYHASQTRAVLCNR